MNSDERLIELIDTSSLKPPALSTIERIANQRKKERFMTIGIAGTMLVLLVVSGAWYAASASPSTQVVATGSPADDSGVVPGLDESLDEIASSLQRVDDGPLLSSTKFYLADSDMKALHSGSETNPFFAVSVRQWRQDDGSTALEVEFNNARSNGGGQCGGFRSGLLVGNDDLVTFKEGQYPIVEGQGFGTVEGEACASIEPVNFARLFDNPFEITDISNGGFSLTAPDGVKNPFRVWDSQNPPDISEPTG